MHNDGKITVEYKVADWNKENYNITFDYPSYDNPIHLLTEARYRKMDNTANRLFGTITMLLLRRAVTLSHSRYSGLINRYGFPHCLMPQLEILR